MKKKLTTIKVVLILCLIAFGDFQDDYPDLEYTIFMDDSSNLQAFSDEGNFGNYFKRSIKYSIQTPLPECLPGELDTAKFKSEIIKSFEYWFQVKTIPIRSILKPQLSFICQKQEIQIFRYMTCLEEE